MANIFFDTNYFINLYTKRVPLPVSPEKLEGHDLFVSTLTYHIFGYAQKVKIPNNLLIASLEKFYTVSLSENILLRSLEGPTNDLEDNIQLHSASKAECNYFLTFDKKLLGMKYFGKTEITSRLPQ